MLASLLFSIGATLVVIYLLTIGTIAPKYRTHATVIFSITMLIYLLIILSLK